MSMRKLKREQFSSSDQSLPCQYKFETNSTSTNHLPDVDHEDQSLLPVSLDDIDALGLIGSDNSTIDLQSLDSLELDSSLSCDSFCSPGLDSSLKSTARNANPLFDRRKDWSSNEILNGVREPSDSPLMRSESGIKSHKRRKAVHSILVTDVDESNDPPQPKSPVRPSSVHAKPENIGFHAVIDLALSSSEATDFNPLELHDAFLNFFEKGEVSDELDSYFEKVLVSEGLDCSTHKTQSTCAGRLSNESDDQLIRELVRDADRSAGKIQQVIERRRRNNEASRRSRAASKERFRLLTEVVECLKSEKSQLIIWLRDIHLAAADVKRVLSGSRPRLKRISSSSHPAYRG